MDEVIELSRVLLEVVEFPFMIVWLEDFPVSNAGRLITRMLEENRFAGSLLLFPILFQLFPE